MTEQRSFGQKIGQFAEFTGVMSLHFDVTPVTSRTILNLPKGIVYYQSRHLKALCTTNHAT